MAHRMTVCNEYRRKGEKARRTSNPSVVDRRIGSRSGWTGTQKLPVKSMCTFIILQSFPQSRIPATVCWGRQTDRQILFQMGVQLFDSSPSLLYRNRASSCRYTEYRDLIIHTLTYFYTYSFPKCKCVSDIIFWRTDSAEFRPHNRHFSSTVCRVLSCIRNLANYVRSPRKLWRSLAELLGAGEKMAKYKWRWRQMGDPELTNYDKWWFRAICCGIYGRYMNDSEWKRLVHKWGVREKVIVM